MCLHGTVIPVLLHPIHHNSTAIIIILQNDVNILLNNQQPVFNHINNSLPSKQIIIEAILCLTWFITTLQLHFNLIQLLTRFRASNENDQAHTLNMLPIFYFYTIFH